MNRPVWTCCTCPSHDCLQLAAASARSLLVSGWTSMHEPIAPVHHRMLWLFALCNCILRISTCFWMDKHAWTYCTCPSQNAMIVCSWQLHQLDLFWFQDGQICMNLLHLSTTDFYDCVQLSAVSMTKHNWCYWLSWTSTVLPPCSSAWVLFAE